MRLSFNSCCIRLHRFRALKSPFCSDIAAFPSLLFFSICVFTFNLDAVSFSDVTNRFWQPPRGKLTGSENDNLEISAAFIVWSALLPILTRFLLWLKGHFFGRGWECGYWDDDCRIPCSGAVRRCVLKYEILFKKEVTISHISKIPYAVPCFLKCSKAVLWIRIVSMRIRTRLFISMRIRIQEAKQKRVLADPDPNVRI